MTFKFYTAYHLPDGTPLDEIRVVEVEVDEAHSEIMRTARQAGAPILTTMTRQGLQEGWITIV